MIKCNSCEIEKEREEFEGDNEVFCNECLEHLLFSAPAFEPIQLKPPTMEDIERIPSWV